MKAQTGFRTTLVTYPSGVTLIAVNPPIPNMPDYAYPKDLESETRKPLLIDGFNEDLELSDDFKISDFKYKKNKYRYLRIDPALVECLQQTRDDFGQGFKVLKAYIAAPASKATDSSWTRTQLSRFQMGQAVEIQPDGGSTDSEVEDLAKSVFRSCSPSLRVQRRGVSVAVRDQSLYVDIHPLTVATGQNFLELHLQGSRRRVWDNLQLYWNEVTKGKFLRNLKDRNVDRNVGINSREYDTGCGASSFM